MSCFGLESSFLVILWERERALTGCGGILCGFTHLRPSRHLHVLSFLCDNKLWWEGSRLLALVSLSEVILGLFCRTRLSVRNRCFTCCSQNFPGISNRCWRGWLFKDAPFPRRLVHYSRSGGVNRPHCYAERGKTNCNIGQVVVFLTLREVAQAKGKYPRWAECRHSLLAFQAITASNKSR